MIQKILEQALLSQAVGDALGEPFEFDKRGGYTRFYDVYHGREHPQLYITDDTQMALFGLHALYEARRDAGANYPGRRGLLYLIEQNYLAWYETQFGDGERREQQGLVLGRHPLFVPELLHARAPGNTCLSALATRLEGQEVKNDSKGNGAVMRSLPFVFAPHLLDMSDMQAINIAVEAARLTHLHLDSSLAVEAYMMVGTRALDDTLSGKAPRLRQHIYSTLVRFPGLGKAYGTDADTFTAIPALMKAFAAIIAYEGDFERVAKYSIVHEGDSDTVAAIACGLHGLAYPAPDTLVHRLVEAAIIRKIVSGVGESADVQQPVQVE